MCPLAFRVYVSFRLFEKFGKLSVMPIIRPGNLEFSGDVMGLSFPARVQACVRAVPRIIITPELTLPSRWGLSFIPWWNIVKPLTVFM